MSDIKPWAWVILAASFGSMFFNSSFFAAGVIHIALIERYPNVDVGTIAWLGSLFSCMFALTVFVGSIVINLFNARTCVMLSGLLTLVGFTLSSFVNDIKLLFVTYSLIAGSGQAMSFAGSMVTLAYYFKENTSIATGIATSGCGLCTFVFPPMTQYFIDTYGLSGAFLFLGGLGFQSAVCGALMKPTEYETRPNKLLKCLIACRRKQTKKSLIEKERRKKNLIETNDEKSSRFFNEKFILFTSAPVWLLFISSAAFHMALSTVYLFLPDYFKHLGSSPQESAFILSIAGITGIFSRILLGFLSASVDTSLVYGSTFGIMGLITFFVNFMSSLGSKVTYTALLGFYTGACWTLQYTLLVDILGVKHASTGYGIMMFFSGMGYLLGPPFAEMVAVWFHDYYFAFVFAGVCFMVAASTGLMIRTKNNKILLLSDTEINDDEKDKCLLAPEKHIISDEKWVLKQLITSV
ncbi:monocarboxylate transporter 12 [Patella vulgata]|uniref:monocarboxylate transporter 12 n=1 Tax=Patella vulgata TaxID=6465 RepID=UPI00217F5BE8|nr:monocarboxylate transporter 12 [Patella vulgata]XP_050405711.1 monocarboxylate transporter 12 [Patella vulgata]